MKAIKVTKFKDGRCSTICSVHTYVMVGSVSCQNCPHFDAYDEGKGTVVLCSHPEQTKGAYVYEKM